MYGWTWKYIMAYRNNVFIYCLERLEITYVYGYNDFNIFFSNFWSNKNKVKLPLHDF